MTTDIYFLTENCKQTEINSTEPEVDYLVLRPILYNQSINSFYLRKNTEAIFSKAKIYLCFLFTYM